MADKLVILLIEDNQDSAEDFKEDAEESIDANVIIESPPVDLLELPQLIKRHQVDAVILDERLQQHSDAAYVGFDAFKFLRDAFPGLPVDIFTEYPHSPELRRGGLPYENLLRKSDFFDNEERKEMYLQELENRMRQYRQTKSEDKKHRESQLATEASETVTEEFVLKLAKLHFELDESVEKIIWVQGDNEKEIRLIEVNRTALPVGGVEVFRFAPSEDTPFPLSIADVTPLEWEQIESGDIPLPESWDLKKIKIFERS